jgi:predicted TIM-barrel fold metal-dependent hydrolase
MQQDLNNTTMHTKPPLTNCHTHIFTGDHVPPFLAKTYIPFPFYYLANLRIVIRLYRIYNKLYDRFVYSAGNRKFEIFKNKSRIFINRFGFIKTILNWVVSLQVLLILYRYLSETIAPKDGYYREATARVNQWLTDKNLVVPQDAVWMQLTMILFLLLFLPSGRNMILFIFSRMWSMFGIFSGHHSKALLQRYLNIGRYAFHKKQHTIFAKLSAQYPKDTRFIVLPMDMEFMEAGKSVHTYLKQMDELIAIKQRRQDTILPFVFADPRRIVHDENYFAYTFENGTVTLAPCAIKRYIETYSFSGFKIYPALGYYPFDEALLPLWKYAADNGLPIITHCIRGTIFYRGKKKENWNRHPVFQQSNGKGEYEPLLLPEMDNYNFTINFTHPLNYLCLLNETLLRKVVSKCGQRIKDLFGFTTVDQPLTHNLSHLKLCFGHFGGDDEWKRFFERDRDTYSSQLLNYPDRGISFLKSVREQDAPGKIEQIWKSVDWYSIICSMMLQYKHVYADISYILHDNNALLPLLKQTLRHPTLKHRVLFGTDFFVVRNHKSDKEMLADLYHGLREDEFDLISRYNPAIFLQNHIATST